MSKFDRSVAVNFKSISYNFGVYTAWFVVSKLLGSLLSRNYWELLDHPLKANTYLRKSNFNFGGKFEFKSWLSYHRCSKRMHSKFHAVRENDVISVHLYS